MSRFLSIDKYKKSPFFRTKGFLYQLGRITVYRLLIFTLLGVDKSKAN